MEILLIYLFKTYACIPKENIVFLLNIIAFIPTKYLYFQLVIFVPVMDSLVCTVDLLQEFVVDLWVAL